MEIKVNDVWFYEPNEGYPVGLELTVTKIVGDIVIWNDNSYSEKNILKNSNWIRPKESPPINNNSTLNSYSDQSKLALKHASSIAESVIDTQHILYGIIKTSSILSHCGINSQEIIELSKSIIPEREEVKGSSSTHARNLFFQAYNYMELFNCEQVDPEHLLLAALSNSTFNSYNIIKKLGVNIDMVKKEVIDYLNGDYELVRENDFVKIYKAEILKGIFFPEEEKLMLNGCLSIKEIKTITMLVCS